MKNREPHFLRVLMIESILFLVLTCTGIFFMPFLEAKERDRGWQKEENVAWKGYYTAIVTLENMIKSRNNKNLSNGYDKELVKMYTEKVELEERYGFDNIEQLGDSYIKIRKQGNKKVWGQLEHNYLQKKVSVVLYGDLFEKLEMSDMMIVWENCNYTIEETKAIPIKLNNYQYQHSIKKEESRLSNEKIQDSILFEFDANRIFSYQIFQDSNYVYITFRNPKEIYDKIVVVDAGHGGTDTGTYAKFGSWDEKDFNLDFVKKIEESWNHDNVKLYFSRLEDTEVTLAERVKFANNLQADLFVSLHCNSSDENSGNGLEALYKSNKFSTDSKIFAKKCLKALEECTGLTNRGLLKGKRIYIIRKAKMPTVLLELGFLSDSGDLMYLSKDVNRKKMAETICQVIWETFN